VAGPTLEIGNTQLPLPFPIGARNFVSRWNEQAPAHLCTIGPDTSKASSKSTPASITVRRGRGTVGQSDSGFGSTSVGVNGQRDFLNRYFIDGLESMDYDAVTFSFSPSVDSISQFKVETSTTSAGNGGAAAAQISLITKSGTNNLHGTLWEFNRNNAFTQTYDAIATPPPPHLASPQPQLVRQ
jgi:hypothetical protein